MRIKQVSVEKLFGIFDHVIPMNMESRITIAHGPNGVGKTIILRMLDSLFSSKFGIFRTIPFREFRVDLENGVSLRVNRKYLTHQKSFFEEEQDLPVEINVSIHDGTTNKNSFSTSFPQKRFLEVAPIIESFISGLTKTGSYRWRRESDGMILTIEDIIDSYRNVLPDFFDYEPTKTKAYELFRQTIKNVKLSLIQANRLYNYTEIAPTRPSGKYSEIPKRVESVVQYSKEIATKIQNVLAEYAETSQSLDRSFPIRLIQQEADYGLDSQELEEKLEKLESQRSRLINLGLLDKNEDAPDIPTKREIENDRGRLNSVLSIYVDDMEKKLAIFNDLAARLEVLQGIINERFLFKQLTLDRNQGFVFVSSDRNTISVESLSSGEQHELVLLFQLLFKVEQNSLILIDEPELSLHVAWQRRFLDDLQEITALGQFDVLIATHSPQIIGDKQDWMVALESPSDEQSTLEHA
jgi:predicted ATP-binding protein involved in virulence